jgi:hypothetical protein
MATVTQHTLGRRAWNRLNEKLPLEFLIKTLSSPRPIRGARELDELDELAEQVALVITEAIEQAVSILKNRSRSIARWILGSKEAQMQSRRLRRQYQTPKHGTVRARSTLSLVSEAVAGTPNSCLLLELRDHLVLLYLSLRIFSSTNWNGPVYIKRDGSSLSWVHQVESGFASNRPSSNLDWRHLDNPNEDP